MTRPSQIETPEHLAKLRCVLVYDEDRGCLFWHGLSGARADRNGMEAGSLRPDGYLQFAFKRRPHLAHRVAWAMHHGHWPADFIDHIDGNRSDNRITNLRVVTAGQNSQNAGDKPRKVGPAKGVHPLRDRFCAYISKGGKKFHLGTYASIADAVQARKIAEILLHSHRRSV